MSATKQIREKRKKREKRKMYTRGKKKKQAEKLVKNLKPEQFPPTFSKEIRKENNEEQGRLTMINKKDKCKQKKSGKQEQPWCSSTLI